MSKTHSAIERYKLIKIAPNTLLVGGGKPSKSLLLEANVPNCVLYKVGDTLHIIDTGVTLEFRQAMLKGVRSLAPFKKLIIHNSHYHSDHTSNNSLIREIEAKERKLYMTKMTFERLNCLPFFLSEWEEMSKNFHMFEGLDFDQDIAIQYLKRLGIKKVSPNKVKQLASLLEEFAMSKISNRLIPAFISIYAVDVLESFEPAAELADFYDNLHLKVIKVGKTEWRGWDFNGEVQVLKAGGHSPDGLIYYLPKLKFLFLADETTPIPIWSDMNMDNALRNFGRYQQMAEDGKVEMMANGHGDRILKKEEIIAFARGLIHTYEVFSKAIKDAVFKAKAGITIDEIYKIIKRKDLPELRMLFKIQFPVLGPFVKGHILNELRNKEYPSKGSGVNKKYLSY